MPNVLAKLGQQAPGCLVGLPLRERRVARAALTRTAGAHHDSSDHAAGSHESSGYIDGHGAMPRVSQCMQAVQGAMNTRNIVEGPQARELAAGTTATGTGAG